MKVLLLAGEESGALYAKSIREEILKQFPAAEVRGYQEYGFQIADLAVMGFVPILKKLFYFIRVKKTMEAAIREWRPDVVCTIDYPGMNLKLAAYAKQRGIRAVHVVCPQVWAWHQSRIPKIEAALDKLCCFFPFEPALFKPGFAEFIGHPLVDEMKREAEAGKATNPSGKLLALLPGSRLGEINRHMPILMQVVARLKSSAVENLDIIIPAANVGASRAIKSYIKASDADAIKVIEGGARDLLRRADAAIVASGTATLEAAIANCPTVLVYRVGRILAAFARMVIKGVKHVGLANVVAEKSGAPCPMPELLQEDFTAENVYALLIPWLTDSKANLEARLALNKTMSLLQSDGNAIARIVRNFSL